MTPAMQSDSALVSLSVASRALAECKSYMEAKHIADVADAARIYLARTNAGIEAVNWATEIRITAERQMGAFVAKMEKAKGRPGPGRGKAGSPAAPAFDDTPTLAALGLTKKQSAQAQRLAAIPDADFVTGLAKAKESARRLTVKAVMQHAIVTAKPMEAHSTNTTADLKSLFGRRFGCIYADPPWKYGNQGTRGATNNHYQTMDVDQIAAMPVADLASERAHLHLWVTNAFLEPAFSIIRAWGFEFKSSFVWVKPQMGMGNYWRNSHEIMLTATRGGLTAASKAEMSWLECKRGEHSVKPDEVRARIERLSPGPYLELFGRKKVSGWTVFGNEVEDALV